MTTSDAAAGFQYDVSSLQKLTQHIPEIMQKLYLYEGISHLMAGGNPTRTQHLLERSSLRHRTPNSSPTKKPHCPEDGVKICSSGEREHATALMMACHHFPAPLLSMPGQRQGMLMEAAQCLEKLGDGRALSSCKQLLLHLGSSTTEM